MALILVSPSLLLLLLVILGLGAVATAFLAILAAFAIVVDIGYALAEGASLLLHRLKRRHLSRRRRSHQWI